MRNFRDINKRDEILTLMKKASATDWGEIWQTLPEIRHHHQIINVRDDEKHQAIVIEAQKDFEFSPRHPVYVRINSSNLIFKMPARSFVVAGNRIASQYPNMAKAIDKRDFHRMPLPPARETTVVLTPLGSGAQELRVKLIDISKKGLGIVITEMNRDYLIRNLQFKITAVNDIYLSGEHKVTLKYVERMGRGMVKSGLGLGSPFTDSTYDLICKTIFY